MRQWGTIRILFKKRVQGVGAGWWVGLQEELMVGVLNFTRRLGVFFFFFLHCFLFFFKDKICIFFALFLFFVILWVSVFSVSKLVLFWKREFVRVFGRNFCDVVPEWLPIALSVVCLWYFSLVSGPFGYGSKRCHPWGPQVLVYFSFYQ